MATESRKMKTFNRRKLLQGAVALSGVATMPAMAQMGPRNDVNAAIREAFGDKPLSVGRVTVSVPRIAENGYSVPITLSVDSPMSPDDHVRRIVLFSSRNPEVKIAEFKFGPHAGRAQVATRIRLGGTQQVHAVAEMSDGSLWAGQADTLVTLAACVVM